MMLDRNVPPATFALLTKISSAINLTVLLIIAPIGIASILLSSTILKHLFVALGIMIIIRALGHIDNRTQYATPRINWLIIDTLKWFGSGSFLGGVILLSSQLYEDAFHVSALVILWLVAFVLGGFLGELVTYNHYIPFPYRRQVETLAQT